MATLRQLYGHLVILKSARPSLDKTTCNQRCQLPRRGTAREIPSLGGIIQLDDNLLQFAGEEVDHDKPTSIGKQIVGQELPAKKKALQLARSALERIVILLQIGSTGPDVTCLQKRTGLA